MRTELIQSASCFSVAMLLATGAAATDNGALRGLIGVACFGLCFLAVRLLRPRR